MVDIERFEWGHVKGETVFLTGSIRKNVSWEVAVVFRLDRRGQEIPLKMKAPFSTGGGKFKRLQRGRTMKRLWGGRGNALTHRKRRQTNEGGGRFTLERKKPPITSGKVLFKMRFDYLICSFSFLRENSPRYFKRPSGLHFQRGNRK